MTFHEGQDVEVWGSGTNYALPYWAKAKIVCLAGVECTPKKTLCYCVQFMDGINAVFDADHIRPIGGAA